MNIEACKISFVKEFLNVDNENIIREVEDLLHKKKTEIYEENLKPMSMAQYKAEIAGAIDDEKNGRLIKANGLKEEIREWD